MFLVAGPGRLEHSPGRRPEKNRPQTFDLEKIELEKIDLEKSTQKGHQPALRPSDSDSATKNDSIRWPRIAISSSLSRFGHPGGGPLSEPFGCPCENVNMVENQCKMVEIVENQRISIEHRSRSNLGQMKKTFRSRARQIF